MLKASRDGMLTILRKSSTLPPRALPIARSRSISAQCAGEPRVSLVARLAGAWLQRRRAVHLDKRGDTHG